MKKKTSNSRKNRVAKAEKEIKKETEMEKTIINIKKPISSKEPVKSKEKVSNNQLQHQTSSSIIKMENVKIKEETLIFPVEERTNDEIPPNIPQIEIPPTRIPFQSPSKTLESTHLNLECRAKIAIEQREKPFACDNCQRIFDRPEKLAKHFDKCFKCPFSPRKTLINTFICRCCSRLFESQNKRIQHEMGPRVTEQRAKQNGGKKSNECLKCGKFLAHSTSLYRHLKLVHGDDEQKSEKSCPDCGRDFGLEQELNSHDCSYKNKKSVWFQADGNYKCDVCEKSFQTLIQILNHYRLIHGRKIWCKCCDKHYTFHFYRIHLKTMGIATEKGPKRIISKTRRKRVPFTPITCPFCGEMTKRHQTAKRLKKHVKASHKEMVDNFCLSCYKAVDSMEVHWKSEHPNEIRCSDCGRIFADREFFEKTHKLERCRKPNRGSQARDYVCFRCKKCFFSEHNLETHFKLEHSVE